MKIKLIRIVFELETTDNQDHAKSIEFKQGMWTSDGPTYPRINMLMREIFKLAIEGIRS